MKELLLIAVASAFVNNVVLSQFLSSKNPSISSEYQNV